MDKVFQILSSPVSWSTGFAFMVVYVGIKYYIGRMKIEDELIIEKRRKNKPLTDDKTK